MDDVNAIVSYAEAQYHIGLEDADDSEEAQLVGRLIDQASAFINRYCNRKIMARSFTEYHDGDGTDILFLNNYPVVSTVDEIEVYVDTDREYGASSKLASDAILIDSESGRIVATETTFTTGKQTVKVVYTAGYTQDTIPLDLKGACLDLIYFWYVRTRKDRIGVSSISYSQGGSVNFETKIPDDIKEILNLYRKPSQGFGDTTVRGSADVDSPTNRYP